MTSPAATLSQSTGRNASPPAVPGLPPSSPAASGAAAGTLSLTPDEEEAVAAYLGRIWKGVTGQVATPSHDLRATLVEITLRKAREQIAQRAH